MGSKSEVKCPSCDYSTVVSGGEDVGMACRTTTIVCKDCKELYDVAISMEPWLERDQLGDITLICPGEQGRYDYGDDELNGYEDDDEDTDDDELEDADEDAAGDELAGQEVEEVDTSNPNHKVEEWTFPGPCPRCGETMAEGGMHVMWD